MAGPEREKRSGFGPWLQAWRHEARLTQQQLAEDLGYDVTYIVKIEGGKRPPTRQFLARLGQLVDQPVEALLRASAADVARPPLPSPPDPLLGRDRELAQIVDLLQGSARCLSLLGPPGIGKTRLAMEVAAHLDPVLAGGAWWVPLLDISGTDAVPGHVRRTLRVADVAGIDDTRATVDRLGDQHALVVLDNFEHVLDARNTVAHLLEGCAHLRILVTSREPLGLRVEHRFRVAPLPYPDPASELTLDAARRSPAVSLFVARARMARADFEMTAANCADIVSACAHLDGVPLSIVLTAGDASSLSPASIARRLRHGRDPAGAAPVDVAAHHRTLAAAIDASWAALPAGARDLFASLAVFSGGFSSAAAAAVHGLDLHTTEALLDCLVRKSLVEARPDAPTGPRFELLDTMRLFVLARLREHGRLREMRHRHLAHYLAVAEDLGRRFTGHGQAAAILALDTERENLGLAFDWALEHDPEASVGLAAAMWRYFLKGEIPTGRSWLEQALAAGIDESPARANALAAAGALGWVSGDADLAGERLAAAGKLAERLDLPDVTALVALNEAALAEQQDRLDDADQWFALALRVYDDLADRRGRASALVGLGMVKRRRGDVDGATPLWAEAAGLYRAVGDRFQESMALGNLAWAAEHNHRDIEAEHWTTRRRRIQIALGDARGLASSSVALGRLAARRGDIQEAMGLYADALVGFQRLGDRPWAASALLALACTAADGGSPIEALLLVGAADALWSSMSARPRGEEQTERDRLVASLQAALGKGGFSGVRDAGLRLTLDEAVEIVAELVGGGGPKPPPPHWPICAELRSSAAHTSFSVSRSCGQERGTHDDGHPDGGPDAPSPDNGP